MKQGWHNRFTAALQRWRELRLVYRVLTLFVCVLLVIAGLGHTLFRQASGAQLGQRAMQLTNNAASAVSDYDLTFTLSTPGDLGSIEVQFCSNDPLIFDPCTFPAGFSASNAVLASQNGETGFSISSASTANDIILTRTVAPATVGPVEYHFTNITNPSSNSTYFVRVQTYASTDASGPDSDYGGIAYEISNPLTVSATVPPYLTFCTGLTISDFNCASAAGDYIDLGELSSSHPSTGTSQMMVLTNAGSGYNITVSGTTMTSGSNVIAPLATADVSRPGTAQFGLNLRANSSPSVGTDPTGAGTGQPTAAYNQQNSFAFVPGATIASNPSTENYRRYTASYLVNVPSTQAPGIYVATLTYICLATF